jgi:sodium-dependent dicarboxylate transporter 2/3/5
MVGICLGPLLFFILLLFPPPGDMPLAAFRVMAVACLMAVWWITEAIPIAATALLPIALFPFLGVMSTGETTVSYANHLIYLFLGGFLIAVTMEKWNLHKRIALHTICIVGVSPRRMILGFMLATAFLSMWISNTATAMMMLPIGMAVIGQVSLMHAMNEAKQLDSPEAENFFGIALMLGIAYAASIGGVATLIGTPPNAILAGMVENLYGLTISFAGWMSFGLPLSAIMLLITWLYLTRIVYPCGMDVVPGAKQLISQELEDLGPLSREEKWVLVVFSFVALAWIIRGFVALPVLKMVSDSSIAMLGALLLFLIPSNFRKGEFLLDWETAKGIPWDIIILFGGGFALAQGFSESGLTIWIADQLKALQGVTLVLLIASVTLVVILLTEVTSNTATATLIIPLMGAMAEAMGVNVYSLMVPAAIAASYAFMLPVATPPNAIVFSSRYVTIPQMARAGLWLNLIAVVLVTLFVFLILPLVWTLDLNTAVL